MPKRTDQQPTTAEKIQEWRNDFPKFAEECLVIQTNDGEAVPFKLNRAQRRVWKLIEKDIADGKPIRAYILKARQLGFSTFIRGLSFWRTSMWRYQNSYTIGHDIKSAQGFLMKDQFFYASMPARFRPVRKRSNRDELYFGRDPGPNDKNPENIGLQSRIEVTTARDPHLGASRTINFLHLSEFARYESVRPEIRTSMASLLPTVPKKPMTFIFIETTAYGLGYAKERWDSKNDGYRKIFVSWIADESYTSDTPPDGELGSSSADPYGNEWAAREMIMKELRFWYPEESADETWVEEESLRRLQWRREKIDELTDINMFMQEYPLYPKEAFLTSGSNVFDLKKLDMMMNSSPPFQTYTFAVGRGWEESHEGKLRVYEAPKPNARYAIGADVAEGNHDGDDSAASVILLPERRQVAAVDITLSPDLWANYLKALGQWYNNAPIAVEINGPGLVTVLHLSRTLGYPYMYYREQFDSDAQKYVRKYGWHTNGNTKTLMISEMRRNFRDESTCIVDVPTLSQMGTYTESNGKYGASGNSNDDLVIAHALALQMAIQTPIQLDALPNEIPQGSFLAVLKEHSGWTPGMEIH